MVPQLLRNHSIMTSEMFHKKLSLDKIGQYHPKLTITENFC